MIVKLRLEVDDETRRALGWRNHHKNKLATRAEVVSEAETLWEAHVDDLHDDYQADKKLGLVKTRCRRKKTKLEEKLHEEQAKVRQKRTPTEVPSRAGVMLIEAQARKQRTGRWPRPSDLV